MDYSSLLVLDTPRLQLIAYTKEMLEAYFKGEPTLASLMGISIPAQWTEFGEAPFRWVYEKYQEDPRNQQ